MPELNKFKGNLLHPLGFHISNENSCASGSVIDDKIELEIFSANCLAACMNALPILKNIHMFFNPKTSDILRPGDDGYLTAEARLWNLSDDGVPDIADYRDGESHFELIGAAYLNVVETVPTTDYDTEIIYKDVSKNYGMDGIVLRPNMTLQLYVSNNTGNAISAGEVSVDVELTVDWVPISESEFDEYLKELWLFQALGED